MRNPGGVLTVVSPEGSRAVDTFTCSHCNRVKRVKVRERPEDVGGLCRMCNKPICPGCVKQGGCDPFEAKLARAEASYEARRSYGLE